MVIVLYIALNSKIVIVPEKEKYHRKIKQINRHKFATFWFC